MSMVNLIEVNDGGCQVLVLSLRLRLIMVVVSDDGPCG